MDWHTVEVLGYSYYAALGYRVLVSIVKTHSYDFVAEKDGKFIRVNVKMAGLKDKSDPFSWSVSCAGGKSEANRKRSSEWVDVYLVYLPNEKRFIELPGDFLAGGSSKCRRIPQVLLGAGV